ncbi:hypothetical protein AMS68_002768 [Peltaster fructicola]|uniref:Cytidyltransferase-like domain-containing protein n=1 Tax=Peltaster fructicola TaxID=286661 RepID=A0A6H0XRG8_9PEZI|nr:hypothetical protein AMS68_002768 [Peltaster fructicola]
MSLEAPPRFLLLLPPPSKDVSLVSFRSDYDETISEVLKEVSLQSESSTGAAVLEIAFALPHLVGSTNQSRSALYHQTQQHLALLYKLIVLIAARDAIDVEDDAGVDVRVIPIAWSPTHTDAQSSYTAPVVDIHALAKSSRVWQYAFGVESEGGEAMVRAFVAAKSQTQSRTTSASSALVHGQGVNHHVAVGGTFDHLHIGHKLLLTMTLFTADIQSGSSITVGLTGDELLKNKKYADVLESWHDREQAIEDFCDSMLDFSSWPSAKERKIRDEPVVNGKSTDLHYSTGVVVKCTQIQDPFGPTITEENISAIILSAETRAGGEAINKKRSEQGWAPLTVFEVDVLDAEAEGVTKEGFDAKLSSTAIRQRLAAKEK